MSQTRLLSGIDRNSSVFNIHYSPESVQQTIISNTYSDLSPKPSTWTSQSSSMMETPQSFTARRQAANNLPTFQLPPPEHLSALHKYPAYASTSATQPTPAVVSSVLTPPAGLPSDGLSPLASSVNSNASSASSNGGPAPYQPLGYWPTPGNSNPSYNYSSAPPLPASFAQGHNYMGRPLYSPSMNFQNRSTNSPTAGEGLPPPPYEMNLPPFPTAMGSSGGGQQQNLPNLAPQQHQQQQPQQQQQQQSRQQQQSQQQQQQQMMNSQQSTSQAPPQGPLHAPDTYGNRPPPTPTSYYTPASTPQQASFPAYTQQSPTQQSPNTTQAPQNRISPVSTHPHPSMAAPQGYNRPYSGYNLPAMNGPILSNVHNPGQQMALVGGNMQMQYPPTQMGQMYGHPGQQQQQNDRPFKCDQCPQSFNRNHDLKRHKRIHLAVKPFPCGHCEKSFSRKDALKRHILVKGCGKPAKAGSQSPVDKSEVMSDSTEDNSPEMMKKEL